MSLGLGGSTKSAHKRKFLTEMNQVVPWAGLVQLIEPYSPEGRRGQPPFAAV